LIQIKPNAGFAITVLIFLQNGEPPEDRHFPIFNQEQGWP